MSRIRFVKMEGAGNDYIYVDAIAQAVPQERAPALARAWCDRHFGIGADGLILLLPSALAAVRMAMWNADGSRGALCGNGLRCVAKLAHDLGRAAGPGISVQTDVGVREVELVRQGSAVIAVRAAIGPVRASSTPITLTVAGMSIACFVAEAGNPHAVVFLDQELADFPVLAVGAAMQQQPQFRGGVNVEFVQLLADGTLRQRTYERGTGETLACGSGAAAAATVARRRGLVSGPLVLVRLRGGELTVTERGAEVLVEGPVRTVFTGEIETGEPG